MITKNLYYFELLCNLKFSLKKDATSEPLQISFYVFLCTKRSWPVAAVINVLKLHPFFSLSHMVQICVWNKIF